MLLTKTIQSNPNLYNISINESEIELELLGNLDIETVESIWEETAHILKGTNISSLKIKAGKVGYCDGIGVGLLYNWKMKAFTANVLFEIIDLKPEFAKLLEAFHSGDYVSDLQREYLELGNVEKFGYEFTTKIEETKGIVEFIGESFLAFVGSIKNPLSIRWNEVLKVSEATGVNALFITGLIGFLLGLIMSFQSAIPMQRFGAEIFVANLVSLSLFRELGPLMTAIILAGRSGSSFAAELGTMKVSEELDALNTMGLSAINFLIVPRLIAAMLMSPLLTLFFNFFGLVGSAIVLMSFGYPLVTFTNQVSRALSYSDLLSGLFKSFVFGLLVAGIGCLCGMRTKEGASAVGESTTTAVVAGIITVCMMDGIFSVLFYYIGI